MVPRQKEAFGMDISIEDLIKSKNDKKQVTILTHFFETHQEESVRMIVTESKDLYEIIVYHPSSPGLKGGVEQYFLNKKTGESHMGWHEHPMKIQEYIIEQKDPAPSSDGKTYLVIDGDNGGACGSILVDGKQWPFPVHGAGAIEPGLHTLECGNKIKVKIKEGTTFHFDDWKL
jgi:hypothetical protein